MNFYNKIKNVQVNKKSMVCVGLDTTGTDSYERNVKIIKYTQDLVCAYKLNLAHYLFDGVEGITNLLRTVEHIRICSEDIIIILDGKFGDIYDTNLIYRDAIFNTFQFDAVTVNPFCGISDIETWFDYSNKGVFVWVSSSTSGRKDIQDEVFGKTVSEYIKYFSEKNNLGFVVGSNNFHHLISIFFSNSDLVLLIPGLGAQGGNLKELEHIYRIYKFNNPIIINSSRQIIFAENPHSETMKLRDQINVIFENKKFL